jgi:hypothetical protein
MMSDNTKYKSWIRKVTCRFCGDVLLEKNYAMHLKRKHEEQHAGDKRSHGQKSISTFFTNPAQKNVSVSSPSEVSENECNIEDEVRDSFCAQKSQFFFNFFKRKYSKF